MKLIVTIAFSFLVGSANAQQTNQEKLVATVKEFHLALVSKNIVTLNQHTDKALSYGHSNGWVENKRELINNLETGLISYQAFKADSIVVSINGAIAHVRFKAEIDATMKGIANTFKLNVLEVWTKKTNRWVLFARQGVKAL